MSDSVQGATVDSERFLSDFVVDAANHDAAPYLPREGVTFLIDAAKAGGAEAPAILAVLSAAGAHVRQSWNAGLNALVLAAERGWQSAQEQLWRSLTFLAFVNDDYQDGETDLPELGMRHRGTRGEGLYFVHAAYAKHAELPPSQGDKWLVSQFVRSRALTPA